MLAGAHHPCTSFQLKRTPTSNQACSPPTYTHQKQHPHQPAQKLQLPQQLRYKTHPLPATWLKRYVHQATSTPPIPLKQQQRQQLGLKHATVHNNSGLVTAQRNFLDSFAERHNIRSNEDWYSVTTEQIVADGGKHFLKQHSHSLPLLLHDTYPDARWLPWRFVRHGMWDDQRLRVQFMEWLGTQLNLPNMESWYEVAGEQIAAHGCESLLKHQFDNSPSKLLQNVFPFYQWLPWKFKKVSNGFWDVKDNRLQYLEWLARELNVKQWQDWYKVTGVQVVAHGGKSLIMKYGSLPDILQSNYPDYPWLPWKFAVVSGDFWKVPENQKRFLDWLFIELKYKNWEDWYGVTLEQVQEKGGAGLWVAVGHTSPALLLQSVYGEHRWIPWKFYRLPPAYWDKLDNQRACLQWLADELGISDYEGWYDVTCEKIVAKGGGRLMYTYNKSVTEMLFTLFPKYAWLPWRFVQAPSGYWDSPANQQQYMDWLAQQLNIDNYEGWYNVSAEQIAAHCGRGLLLKHEGSPCKLLQAVFPNYPWLPWKFPGVRGYFAKKENVKPYLEWLIEQKQLSGPHDLLHYNDSFLRTNHGGSLLAHYHTLTRALEVAYPDIDWKAHQELKKSQKSVKMKDSPKYHYNGWRWK